ncbi:hypothetical protein C942_02835 [Photobacterium marinum]|uniref:Uncharacterized protein n=1 Tax=Photobacterium marinum TaxID=1056511 RepID=L8J7X6_9GAMM|nr:hypothetical protein C942_02835 [Photobacterium marinum]
MIFREIQNSAGVKIPALFYIGQNKVRQRIYFSLEVSDLH